MERDMSFSCGRRRIKLSVEAIGSILIHAKEVRPVFAPVSPPYLSSGRGGAPYLLCLASLPVGNNR